MFNFRCSAKEWDEIKAKKALEVEEEIERIESNIVNNTEDTEGEEEEGGDGNDIEEIESIQEMAVKKPIEENHKKIDRYKPTDILCVQELKQVCYSHMHGKNFNKIKCFWKSLIPS